MRIHWPNPVAAPRLRRGAPLSIALAVLAVEVYTVVVLALFAAQVDPPTGYRAFVFVEGAEKRAQGLERIAESFAERLAPFDGQYYLDIAARGYRRIAADDPNARSASAGNYAFFPLYPLCLRALGFLERGSRILAMVVIQSLLVAAAAVGVSRLARHLAVPPWPSVLLVLAFPTATFQSVLYSESLFLALTVGAALCALERRVALGAAFGFLAAFCRPQGILVAALWLPSFVRRRSAAAAPLGATRRAILLVPMAAPLVGLAVFAAILALSIGEPLGFVAIQSQWSREFSAGSLFAELLSPFEYAGPPFDLVALALAVALLPYLWRRLPAPLALYGTLSVVLPLATGTVLSFGRFLSVSFPHFLALGALVERRPLLLAIVVGFFVVLRCALAKGLVAWEFVG